MSASRNKLYKLLCAVTISGVCLQLSGPPSGLGVVVLVAFTPVLIALQGFRSLIWFFAGLALGLCLHIQLFISLVGWGLILPLVCWITAGALTGSAFAMTSFMQERLSGYHAWVAFPSSWVLVSLIGDYVFPAPITLAPFVVLDIPELIYASKVVGIAGNEFLLASVSAILANFFIRQSLPLAWLLMVSITLVTTSAYLHLAKSEDLKTVKVAGIQPAISYQGILASEWSLYSRSARISQLDRLTARGLQSSDIAIWPETGNGIPNAQFAPRVQLFKSMLRGTDKQIWASGIHLTEDGSYHNTVTQFTQEGPLKSSSKSLVVPFAESHLDPGKNQIFHYEDLNVGIAICFEALFRSHFYSLLNNEANFIVVVTNDSSFENSYLGVLHAGYVLANSIAVDRAVVFLNNNGLSFAADKRGRIIDSDTVGRTPSIYQWDVPATASYVPGLNIGAALFWALFIGYAIYIVCFGTDRNQRPSVVTHISQNPILWLCMSPIFSITLGISLQAYNLKQHPIETVRDIMNVYILGTGGLDHTRYSGLISRNEHAYNAVAYILTSFGQTTLPEQLSTKTIRADTGNMQWSLIQELLTRSGFLHMFESSGPIAGHSINWPYPSIVRMNNGSFKIMTGVDNNDVMLVDDATGAVRTMDIELFNETWSREKLLVWPKS